MNSNNSDSTTTSTGVKPYRYTSNSTAPDESAEPFREWHRTWGRKLYASDLDFIEYSFSGGRPVICGVFEYKHMNGRAVGPDSHQLHITAEVGLRCRAPAFFVRYCTRQPWTFLVYPMNTQAANWTKRENAVLSEREFVQLLHNIRGEEIPPRIAAACSTQYDATGFPWDAPPFLHHGPTRSAWAFTASTTTAL